jgi:hypothetical protein
MDNIHERVAVTGCCFGAQDKIECPTCKRPMTRLGGAFGWFEYVCYGDCDAVMMENDMRAEREHGKQ